MRSSCTNNLLDRPAASSSGRSLAQDAKWDPTSSLYGSARARAKSDGHDQQAVRACPQGKRIQQVLLQWFINQQVEEEKNATMVVEI